MEKWIKNYQGYKDIELYRVLEDAAREWVKEFNAIPASVVEKLLGFSDYTDFNELTPFSVEELEKQRDYLPMWGTLWAFGSSFDKDWIDKDALGIMKLCGFRIYASEDWDYVFGIDGSGYDFYEAHWIPLYLERGLRWHESDPRWAAIVEKYEKV